MSRRRSNHPFVVDVSGRDDIANEEARRLLEPVPSTHPAIAKFAAGRPTLEIAALLYDDWKEIAEGLYDVDREYISRVQDLSAGYGAGHLGIPREKR